MVKMPERDSVYNAVIEVKEGAKNLNYQIIGRGEGNKGELGARV